MNTTDFDRSTLHLFIQKMKNKLDKKEKKNITFS